MFSIISVSWRCYFDSYSLHKCDFNLQFSVYFDQGYIHVREQCYKFVFLRAFGAKSTGVQTESSEKRVQFAYQNAFWRVYVGLCDDSIRWNLLYTIV